MLSEEYSNWKASKILYYPAMVINNKTIRGKIEASMIFNAICNGFNETPANCYNDYNSNKGGVSTFTVLMLLLLIVLITTGIIYWSIRKSRKSMYENIDFIINARITQYQSMKDQKAAN
jgi:hypothetical protein